MTYLKSIFVCLFVKHGVLGEKWEFVVALTHEFAEMSHDKIIVAAKICQTGGVGRGGRSATTKESTHYISITCTSNVYMCVKLILHNISKETLAPSFCMLNYSPQFLWVLSKVLV